MPRLAALVFTTRTCLEWAPLGGLKGERCEGLTIRAHRAGPLLQRGLPHGQHLRASQRRDRGRTEGPEPPACRTVPRPPHRPSRLFLLPQRADPHRTEIFRRSGDADHRAPRRNKRVIAPPYVSHVPPSL